MTILLIEDEPVVARQLEKLVRQLEPQATIDGPLPSVEQVADYLQNNPRPDLIISDIQLSDGVSFDVFGRLEVSCPIIFTTAYDEYAIRAFKLNSLDYLLKPIDPDDMQSALAKFHRWQPDGDNFQQQFRAFLADMTGHSTHKSYKRRFTGHYLRQIVSVPQEQVAYFCRDEVIYLHTLTGQKLITDYVTLDELEELVDPAAFFRANRQYLVHLEAITGYQPHYSGKLLLTLRQPSSLEITISKDKAPAFRKWFEQG
ncbi:two component transcriptional regulator, LytTR family [Fibrisoma limi BUZ 3]|uniref:Two component transcriptional regulator, LytTR family n=1 Tax=Fibrisoma limi BUZ 3 TaxID=1185876 RepID=I2GF20_9BACT|nr:LytTR family DNA-binding domain-containing protein [Fibrisoma limi]CCH52495.1 two component transcriptional regulator, LytTR family [Fibrisoma limi BUZ 3]